MENVKKIEDPTILKLISKLSIPLKYNTNYSEYLDDPKLITNNRSEFYNITPNNTNLDKFKLVINDFKKIFKELENKGIEQVDINVGNIGLKNSHLCLYDISGRHNKLKNKIFTI